MTHVLSILNTTKERAWNNLNNWRRIFVRIQGEETGAWQATQLFLQRGRWTKRQANCSSYFMHVPKVTRNK